MTGRRVYPFRGWRPRAAGCPRSPAGSRSTGACRCSPTCSGGAGWHTGYVTDNPHILSGAYDGFRARFDQPVTVKGQVPYRGKPPGRPCHAPHREPPPAAQAARHDHPAPDRASTSRPTRAATTRPTTSRRGCSPRPRGGWSRRWPGASRSRWWSTASTPTSRGTRAPRYLRRFGTGASAPSSRSSRSRRPGGVAAAVRPLPRGHAPGAQPLRRRAGDGGHLARALPRPRGAAGADAEHADRAAAPTTACCWASAARWARLEDQMHREITRVPLLIRDPARPGRRAHAATTSPPPTTSRPRCSRCSAGRCRAPMDGVDLSVLLARQGAAAAQDLHRQLRPVGERRRRALAADRRQPGPQQAPLRHPPRPGRAPQRGLAATRRWCGGCGAR